MAVDFVIGAIASAPASKQQLVISDIGRGYGQWIANRGPRTVDSGQWSHAALTAGCRAVQHWRRRCRGEGCKGRPESRQ